MTKKILLLLLACWSVQAQTDSTNILLNQVTVSANISSSELIKTARNVTVITAKQIEEAPVKTIDGILRYALNIDVRSRSPFGVQSDVSIRGGNFEQTLVLIDGVKMNDPQTGHHAFNVPIPITQIEKIEVLQGGASRVFGPAAFSGVINIITKKVDRSGVALNLGGGAHRLGLIGGTATVKKDKIATIISAERLASDGYAYNTAFIRQQAYVKNQFEFDNTQLSVSAGILENNFGAANFYHPKFFDQYEEINSKFVITKWVQNISPIFQSTTTFSLRQHRDLYDFNRFRYTNPDGVNHHKTNVLDAEWRGGWINKYGKTSVGLEWRQEQVYSNRLGEVLEEPVEIANQFGIFYDKFKLRTNASTYFEHRKNFEKLSLTFGTMYNLNSQFGNQWFPGVDIAYNFSPTTSVFTSSNRSYRFPTFTEMYLNTATVVGNPFVLPESAWSYEVGYKKISRISNVSISAFMRKSDTAIDKVLRKDQTIPAIENINNLDVFGVELAFVLNAESLFAEASVLKNIGLNYAYIDANQQATDFQSFYSLNFLRQKLNLTTNFAFAKHLRASLNYTFKQRAGSYQLDGSSPLIPYEPIHLVDARLSWKNENYLFYVDANNLLNYAYYEFGFVEQPGRWITAGLTLKY